MAKRRKKRLRFKNMGRFLILVGGAAVVVVGALLFMQATKGKGEIQLGTIDCDMEVTAAVVRSEKVVMTEPYEKISFNVVEGQTVANGDLIAQVYKRGYQDETMISLLNLQKQIYTYQVQLLGGSQPQELIDLNANIATVEEQIRSVARGESTLDMLDLEQTLKSLQTERCNLLSGLLTADASLNGMYSELKTQQSTQDGWKRDILNESGAGIVSFYFDGYEQVLNLDKLSTINGALVNSVVKGGNTAKTTTTTSETPLYRIIGNTHWYLMFVTKAAEPLRLASDEEYTVTFTDYSDQPVNAFARDTTVSESYAVNKLEFNTDIGKLSGVRTVNILLHKSAQGLVVPLDAIEILLGVPGINVEYGDQVLRVEVEVLAADEKKAVIRPANDADSLAAGQKYRKP